MSKRKMSQEEFRAKAQRLDALIQKSSEAGLRGVKEHAKRGFSFEEMREAVKRHHREAAEMWNQGPTKDD